MKVTIQEAKKALNIDNADIAEFFGYNNRASYQNSNKKKWIENGIIEIYKRSKKAQK